jgi:hypothetical protein
MHGYKNKEEADPELLVRAGRSASPFPCLLLLLIAHAVAFAGELPEKKFDLTIARGALPAQQRMLRVDKDDVVRLRVTSDAAGEIHLHAYRQEMKLAPGTPAELTFKARATGRFRIEWHAAGDTAKKGDHHGQPLATLEVRPK